MIEVVPGECPQVQRKRTSYHSRSAVGVLLAANKGHEQRLEAVEIFQTGDRELGSEHGLLAEQRLIAEHRLAAERRMAAERRLAVVRRLSAERTGTVEGTDTAERTDAAERTAV